MNNEDIIKGLKSIFDIDRLGIVNIKGIKDLNGEYHIIAIRIYGIIYTQDLYGLSRNGFEIQSIEPNLTKEGFAYNKLELKIILEQDEVKDV